METGNFIRKQPENQPFLMGIDIGSTTAKIVILDSTGKTAFDSYRRHNTDTLVTLRSMIEEAEQALGEIRIRPLITGSAGLGLCEQYDLPFIQEVIASAEVVRCYYPQVQTLLDIGGEDAKLIFFDDGKPDIRMNGACAGGTGAFIDQMASLLNVPIPELNTLAAQHTTVHPIASRCGVFAKTDVQNLLSRDVSRADIAASIFNAVVWQTLATLSRGRTPDPVVLFAGGPLTFLPELKNAFLEALALGPEDWLEVEHAELLTARGAALAAESRSNEEALSLRQFNAVLEGLPKGPAAQGRLGALFNDPTSLQAWQAEQTKHRVRQVDIHQMQGKACFLGIDSGSTTTKIVLVDEQGRLCFDDYSANHGNAIGAAQAGLEKLRVLFDSLENPPIIVRSTVTGYGEDLIRAAFGCDEGMVETLAHFRAAHAFDPQVSFILDIGGQDMKAIFVKNGQIRRIEINEACSSGCGTFIETFARSLGRSVSDFAAEACQSSAPCDLGTRCTVFMNSRVKQSLREGAAVADISAGLAYSVIKNALNKVLRITDAEVLGDHIVVQGGSFRNPAIQKALEQVLGKRVVCPDKAELMGALGAALHARDAYQRTGRGVGLGIGLDNLATVSQYKKQLVNCRGCENRCMVTKITFHNSNIFYTGNRCERTFSNRGIRAQKGANLYARKRELLFDRPMEPAGASRLTIGLPRALNFFENFPFWCTLFVESGIKVRLSDASNKELFESGVHSVMSENICFPAKLLNGHIENLIKAEVDRIFYPMVFYEKCEFGDSINSFNCPVVSGYPDVIRSAIDPLVRSGVPFDQPAITFQTLELLKKTCQEYLEGLGVKKAQFESAFTHALTAQEEFKQAVRRMGAQTLEEAEQANRRVVVLSGHPYHLDPLVNHKIPEALAEMGVDVLTEDAVPLDPEQILPRTLVLTQWEYLNRMFHAANWVGGQANVEFAQLNSFGCGPDAFALDETRSILENLGKNHTVLRIDEIDSLGAARLRLRSMLESLPEKDQPDRQEPPRPPAPRKTTRLYRKTDKRKIVLVPEFSRFCSPPLIRPFKDMGYRMEILPTPDQESVQIGLKYTNNEICYPGILVIGDTLKALQSGKYDPQEVIIGSWETGGQCRASNISWLLKKALVMAGYEDIPVVALSTSLKPHNPQPDFKFNLAGYLYKAMLGMVYTDGISAMYHATAVREINKGQAKAMAEKWMVPFDDGTIPLTRRGVFDNLEQAVSDFNNLPTHTRTLPQVGIVGEVYVKYNTFVNSHIVQWLMDQEMEVVLPPLLTFFLGSFVGFRAGVKERLRQKSALWYLAGVGEKLVQSMLDKAETVLNGFRYYHPHRAIKDVAETASEILNLTHQYGEGWLLSGEVGEFVKSGVKNVLCLQPFGCIANHVIAKGVSRRLKLTYPQVNLLFLDLDASGSEVNLLNRAHFFVEQARLNG